MSLNAFQLSFFEASEINKIIPQPYKLELESNISIDLLNNKTKRVANNNKSHSLSTRNKSHSKLSTLTSTSVNKKKHPEKQNHNSNNKNNNLTINESEKKICENFYAYIENCEYCNVFYTQKYLDEPCLIDIKNKIKSRKYHYLLEIVMDLRNLCLYYSERKFNNSINYNANKLLEYVESIYKSFYSKMSKES